MNNPLVSVNITTYNRAHLLRRCLKPVFSQSYPNIEIVIVDDCSSDETPEVIHKLAAEDKRLKYFRHKTNQGNAFSRNTALKHCNGKYIAFLDDDDEWIDVHKLKKQVGIFEKSASTYGIVCSNVISHRGNTGSKPVEISKPDNLREHILKRNGIIFNSTVMTKRSILEQTNGFDIQLPRGIDSDFYRMCIVTFGYDVFFMNDYTTLVHEHGADRMTNYNTKQGLKNVIRANIYLIRKYRFAYPAHLSALSARLWNVAKAAFSLYTK